MLYEDLQSTNSFRSKVSNTLIFRGEGKLLMVVSNCIMGRLYRFHKKNQRPHVVLGSKAAISSISTGYENITGIEQ